MSKVLAALIAIVALAAIFVSPAFSQVTSNTSNPPREYLC
jgi:hypothetical protein